MYGGRIIWELLNVNNSRTNNNRSGRKINECMEILQQQQQAHKPKRRRNNNTKKYKTVKDSYINNNFCKIPITTAKRTTTTSKFLANSCFHICTIGLPAIHPPPRRGAACRHLLQEEVLRADQNCLLVMLHSPASMCGHTQKDFTMESDGSDEGLDDFFPKADPLSGLTFVNKGKNLELASPKKQRQEILNIYR